MSTAARIDELRKKFEENPRRYFAPLANEYRKSGDLAMAVALCREHLPKQPGHMSGYIVFGQALYESGDLGEARAVFEQALALDPENLIALRHLGDIARADGDALAARRWYERVLDADPRNDDIAAQLATLATGLTPTSVLSFAEPTAPSMVPAANSSIEPFTRTPLTPPPMVAIGIGALPTPDAVMRAVDLDAFSGRMNSRTPIDLDEIETPPVAPPAESAAAPTGAGLGWPSVSGNEILHGATHAEAVEKDDVADVPEEFEATQLVVSPRDEADAFDFPDVPTSASIAAVGSGMVTSAAPVGALTTSEPQAAPIGETDPLPPAEAGAPFEEEFEEGLVAPEWPETSAIVARIVTPRATTPSVAPNAITPPTQYAVGDAVAAFGREPHDPMESPLSSDASADSHERMTPRWDTPRVSMASVVADASTADEEFHIEPLPPELAAAFAEPTTSEATVTAIEHAGPEIEEDVSFDADVVALGEEAHTTDLPWISTADSVPNDREPTMSSAMDAPGLEEIVEAFAVDARAAGDDERFTVAALDGPVPADDITLFAADRADVVNPTVEQSDVFLFEESEVDEMQEVAADVGGEFDDGEESVLVESADIVESEPAFVTETMGELLVSQGFVARAIGVYGELVRRRPYDPLLSSRLAELQAQMAPLETSVYQQQAESADASADLSSWADEAVAHASAETPTPSYGRPGFATNTPLASRRVTPYAHPAAAESFAPRRSAREWFSAIAARRVPRRTPPIAVVAVTAEPSSLEGLSSLFGTDTSLNEDAAARALADAFAPVSARDLESGTTLDFEFARSTPEFVRSITPVMATSMPIIPTLAQVPSMRPRSMTPAAPSSSVPSGGGNAGFSFDKFFPDPANRRGTPAAPSPALSEPPVTDDLAQFSAWLKGLGNS